MTLDDDSNVGGPRCLWLGDRRYRRARRPGVTAGGQGGGRRASQAEERPNDGASERRKERTRIWPTEANPSQPEVQRIATPLAPPPPT